ncbi:prephenate dehydrogenase, partial [mine drainage metagenome]
AIVSHLPHVIASVMAMMLAHDGSSALGSSLAAGSFEDAIRVAGSPLGLSNQMCNANLDMLLDAFQQFQAWLEPARKALTSAIDNPSTLDSFFTGGYEAYVDIHASGSSASEYGSRDMHSTIFPLNDQQTLSNWMLGLGLQGGRIIEIGYPSYDEVAISYVLPPKPSVPMSM